MKLATNLASLCALAIVLTIATSMSTMAAAGKNTVVNPTLATPGTLPLAAPATIPVVTITAKRLTAAQKAQ